MFQKKTFLPLQILIIYLHLHQISKGKCFVNILVTE